MAAELELLANFGRKRAAEREVRGRADDEEIRRRAREVVRLAERDAFAAACRIEDELETALAPLVGGSAGVGLRITEQALRLAIVSVLSPERALLARRRAAGSQMPAYVCRGNPLFGHERFDYLGPPGCRHVFRGQWRPSRSAARPVHLGPRCERCRGRITEDRRAWIARRVSSSAE